MRVFRAFVLSLVLGYFAPAVDAAQMKVPFNFQWGESEARVEKSIVGSKARVIERKTVQNRHVLAAEGIPQKSLQRTLFYFSNDSLNEIELQYGDPSWDSNKYDLYFDDVRRNVDLKYGPGRIIVREKNRDPDSDILHTLIGYQWTQGYMCLRLFLFTSEKTGSSHRVLSLHYKEI
ncbi:MAG: hypothetical protein NTW41_08835 [Verrucomicrobia bacterium]|jgi:hypothetical protein|nr:hypothetical protein [Verrucomicrobiota bacterium]